MVELKKIKNKKITEKNITEKNITEKKTPENVLKGGKNNLQDLKKRLEIESDYIESLLSLIKIPLPVIHEEEKDVYLGENLENKKLFGNAENRAKSHEELKERFRKKMEQFQEKNKKKDGTLKEVKVKEVLTKQMKRAANKKKKRELLKKGLIKASASKGNLNKANLGSFEGVMTKDGDENEHKQNIVFSKFDFVESSKGVRGPQKNNDPKAALQKIKLQKEKLKKMKERGQTEKVDKIESKEKWKKAMQKSEGVKVKDDEELLKKTIRRKDHDKRKGANLWKEQKEKVDHGKSTKQKKRDTNLMKRKTDKKDKKKKLAIKKGRLIPGL